MRQFGVVVVESVFSSHFFFVIFALFDKEKNSVCFCQSLHNIFFSVVRILCVCSRANIYRGEEEDYILQSKTNWLRSANIIHE